MLRIINLSKNPTPKYAHKGDAGLDIMANESVIIPPESIAVVGTGLYIALPEGTEGQVRSRSGNSIRGLVVNNAPGTIDETYRGEVKVILKNQNKTPYRVNIGDRIAQLVIAKYERLDVVIVETLDPTERGENGFGSTGR